MTVETLIRVLGAILVVGGMAALGVRSVLRLRYRTRLLTTLCSHIDTMANEIEYHLTPLPELILLLERDAPSETKPFLAQVTVEMEHLGQLTFGEIWERALNVSGLDLKAAELVALRDLGHVLGRYDPEGQLRSIRYIRQRMLGFADSAQTEQTRQGKVYATMSVISGLAVVVIFI